MFGLACEDDSLRKTRNEKLVVLTIIQMLDRIIQDWGNWMTKSLKYAAFFNLKLLTAMMTNK